MQDLKGRLKNTEKKTVILGVIGLTLLTGAAVTASTIITGSSQPDGHELNATTLSPVQVTPTEAEFRANLTDLDSIYDAALIKWNYTNLDTGETFKGPANIAFSEGETVKSLQHNLNASQQYRIDTYTEPVIWDDENLYENVLQSKQAMEEIAADINGRTKLISSQYAEETLWSSGVASKEIWKAFKPKPPEKFTSPPEGYVQTSLVQSSYTDGKVLEFDQQDGSSGGGSNGPFVYHSLDLDLTGKERLNISVLRTDQCSYDEFKITINGDTVFTDQSCHGWQNNSIDVSTYSGSKEIRIGQQIGRYQERSPTTKVTNIVLN